MRYFNIFFCIYISCCSAQSISETCNINSSILLIIFLNLQFIGAHVYINKTVSFYRKNQEIGDKLLMGFKEFESIMQTSGKKDR